MSVTPEILFALGAFAMAGGRICGGVQWHSWNRAQRGRRNARAMPLEDVKAWPKARAT